MASDKLLFILLVFWNYSFTRCQIVSSIEYQSLVCEGDTVDFVCPRGYVMEILTATWGRNNATICASGDETDDVVCDVWDVPDLLRGLCEGKETCRVDASSGYFGDCLSTTNKYLSADYLCYQKMTEVLMCENTGKMLITCPGDERIQVESAFFGRRDFNVTCPHPTAMRESDCSADTATEVFKQRCDGERECEIDATSYVFGDPCPGSYKYLKLEYTCAACENQYETDKDCDYWFLSGECQNNPPWMTANCRKSCWGCDKTEPPCENDIGDELCQQNVEAGDCEAFPAWMLTRCRKACLGCDKSQDTVCVNKYQAADENAVDCTELYQTGECTANPDWMLGRCTASCFDCQEKVRCEDKVETSQCEEWAEAGECENNPGYMIPLCMKTCLQCTSDPVCANERPDDECDYFASLMECRNNPMWMYTKCWKSCMNCDGPPACTNQFELNSQCDEWAMSGECDSNAEYMMLLCRESCTRCNPEKYGISRCLNKNFNETECYDWMENGECSGNPIWMYSQCNKACGECDDPFKMTFIGNKPQPGPTNDWTNSYSIIIPDEFPVEAKLTHYLAFFNTTQHFYLEVWRPIFGSQTNLERIHRMRYKPKQANTAETINVDDCVMVRPGDKFGFSVVDATAPVASIYDIAHAQRLTYFRATWVSGDEEFDFMPLPYAFSLSAAYDEDLTC